MDIEEYLRQKRELEAKKEMLEAKEKVDQDKDRFKKEQRAKLYAEHGVTPKHPPSGEHTPLDRSPSHTYQTPSAGPGLWNMALLFLILVLLVVSYFMPRFGEDQIRSIVKQEAQDKKISTQEKQAEKKEEEDEVEQKKEVKKPEEKKKEENLPDGPLITLLVKDNEEGLFDDDGKIDGEILVVDIEKGLKYYEDFTIQINNKEAESITCEIDRDVQIDTNFDGKIDLKDIDLRRHVIQINPKLSKTITSDVVPGTIDTGNYEGRGDISTTYEAKCSFCEDDECKIPDKSRGESSAESFFRVWINKELKTGTNTTTNTTNRTR